MSRPWNVLETGSSRHGESPMSNASSTPPKRSAASISSPLSGPDQPALAGAQRDGAARAADARVDDGEMHAGGRERQRASEPPGAGADVLRRDAVAEVDDADVRRDPRDHAMDHADVLVADPVVGEEREHHCASSAAIRPSGVCGSASMSGSAPWARSSALVAGPIETSFGPRSSPPAAAKKRTEEADVKST